MKTSFKKSLKNRSKQGLTELGYDLKRKIGSGDFKININKKSAPKRSSRKRNIIEKRASKQIKSLKKRERLLTYLTDSTTTNGGY